MATNALHTSPIGLFELNASLTATDEEKYLTMLALAEGKLSESDFAAWLRGRIGTGAGSQAHDPQKKYVAKRRRLRPRARTRAAR